MPLLSTNVADVEIHQIHQVILDINYVWVLSALITITCHIGTADIFADVGQPRVLTGEFI